MSFDWDAEEDDFFAGPSVRSRQAVDEDFPIPDDFADPVPGFGDPIGLIPQDTAEETNFQQLIRHWMNERHSPDILPGQEVLLGNLLDHIRKQTDDVQLLRADPGSSEDEHFRIMLVHTEIERVKFVIRSYIRTRLHKIEKYARHINSDPNMYERLSKAEFEHAKRYARLEETHYTSSVLQSLPIDQQGLDDNIAFMPPMIPAPSKTRAVFVHARQDCPRVKLLDGSMMEMKKDQISLVPYNVIEHLLARGEVELV
ncbi:hypothetical protein QCA50_015147 [Cerrena zonata]|uniref:DNA replication complex GINS protein SLD5 n=1 Tax=Cerrena zonata TaxID=2478898 RepID=A0AAW0FSF0_9APHY